MAKTLTVFLAADLKNFNRNMSDAEGRVRGFGGTLSNMLGPALLAAGAAAGAFAVKLGVDGVKAAIEDEAASAKLAQTLTNLGLAHDTAPVEAYVSSLERSLGIADDELRPAYDRLVRSIGNTEEANRALSLALDVSAGTGKSLDAVVQALGRAYDGNTAGLSRLGAGIDAATLKTGDMDAITRQLAATFAGQATTQAQTFEGQIGRVSIAFDNLKEAFGAGFLSSLNDTNDSTQSLVDSMERLEPLVNRIGSFVGDVAAGALEDFAGATELAADASNELARSYEDQAFWAKTLSMANYILNTDLLTLGNDMVTLRKITDVTGESMDQLGTLTYQSAVAAERATPGFAALTDVVDDIGAEASQSAVQVASMAQALAAVGGNTFNWRREVAGATEDAENFSIELNWNAYQARRAAAAAQEAAMGNKSYGGSASAASVDSEKLTGAQKRLTDAYTAQEGVVNGTRDQLKAYAADLAIVTEAAEAYADSITSALMDTIDLGAAFNAQFDDEGQKTGQSLVDGFNAQIAQAEWFGNVLNELKRQGADASLISEIAGLGADVGGALGQQLITDGLVGTINEKWLGVAETIRAQAATLVPEFLQAGIASGTDLITGLSKQLQNEVGTLSKIGKQIAKPVGAEFKAQIAADIAEALKQVEAASSAARAEKVAQAERQAAALTEQAVAQALGNIIGRSDARTGRPQPNVPFLVLG
jgi:hypothetical protein